MIYVLDAGHGKITKGKRSPDGRFREYEFNRRVARAVGEKLNILGIVYHYTYPLDDPNDLEMTKRANVANKYAKEKGSGNVLFISIHANAASNGSWSNAQGWSIYTTKGQTNSDKYAEIFWEEAEKICQKTGRKIRKDMSDSDHDFESNFTVIYKTICPSVLIENFFYDNKEEVEWLMTQEAIEACSDIIVNGIKRIEGF